MEEQFDYLKEYCDSEKTKTINAKLLAMYEKWYDSWYKGNESRYANFSTSCKGHPDQMVYLNKPLLLTCTDAYLGNRVILFGKEAHDTDSSLSCFRCELDRYFDSSTYKYDTAIRFDERENGKKKARNTEFLKARKICAELESNVFFSEDSDSFKKFSGVLVNNLNKVSYGGRMTSAEKRLEEIYAPFEFDKKTGNVFYHEFRILQPRKVLFLCGRGYTKHLIRDFGPSFSEELISGKLISSKGALALREDETSILVSVPKTLVSENECNLENEHSIEYIYGYHPSFLQYNGKKRNQYYKSITAFVKSNIGQTK